jgi:hypothetical protein
MEEKQLDPIEIPDLKIGSKPMAHSGKSLV